ncbi:uncharacterized protein B0T23DRAFT_403227 [Neurospora hispaniola]|uniref:Uncharacterized protein n=1 Tax=Neurospora hispaniola TaxID=588809 RepID=A0AAJ0I976_9PEZI|nr:hypothetical protein B0T23DRAFT_403227 [Neurospora hispaniola]
MNSIVPKRKIRNSWIVDPNQTKDRRYVNNDIPIAITEEICREEADRLKLTCVVIRQLAHETRIVYKNGRTVTPDSHFTVYMRVSKSQLLLQGHTYVVWDPVLFGNLKKMTDPLSQRKYVSQGPRGRMIIAPTTRQLPFHHHHHHHTSPGKIILLLHA